MVQLTYNDNPGMALAGMRFDTGFGDVISRLAATRQLEEVVVTTADNTQTFTVTINGTAYDYVSDGTATKDEISAGLKTAIDAGGEPVVVVDDLVDTLTIESTDHDAGFTISVGATGAGVLTLTNLVAQEQAVEFGVFVVEDENVAADSLTGKPLGARLPRLATDITGNKTLGLVLRDTSKVTRQEAPLGGYSAGEAMAILTKGRVWVEVETGDIANVAKGGQVFVRHLATGTEKLGAVRATDDGTDTDPLPADRAEFTGQVSGNLAVVSLNL
jgi:hypothetical protein